MKKILGILMTALLLCAAALCFAEDAAYIGTVTGGKLHMRKSPSADGKVITTCASGTQVDVLSVDGEWCKVRLGEKVGYMKTRYLTLEALAPHLGWGKTPADGSILLLYAQPDTQSEIVAQQMSGGVFDLAAKENGFYQVTLGRGQAAYLESGKVTLLSGDFERSFAAGDSGERITPAVLGTAEHAFGSARTMSRSSGRFLYEITYPDTGFAAVDGKIENWVNETLAAFERNHVLHHKEENASLKIHYQAAKLDDRYGSVLLMAEYKTASDTLHALYALNLDLSSGTVLTMNDLFSSQQKPLFCLRAKAEALMPNPSLGYGSQPDSSWLQYAVITRAGLEVYLPAGLYLPSSLGTQKVLLTYRNIGAAMKLDSQRIADAVNWIDPTRPMLALTFDDGPSEETARILAVLDQYDGHATFCVQGYKVDALDFLVKPVAHEVLDACLARALRRLRKREPASLSVRSGGSLRIVPVSSILYAESREHRTLLRTREEEIPCAGSLGSIEESLIPHGFYRCHAAFVVSFAQVERLDGGDVLVGGQRVPLSKHRRRQFLAALAAFWGDRG